MGACDECIQGAKRIAGGAVNLGRSVVAPDLPLEASAARLAICVACERFELTDRPTHARAKCGVCGCFIAQSDSRRETPITVTAPTGRLRSIRPVGKLRLASQSCPMGKWGAIAREGGER